MAATAQLKTECLPNFKKTIEMQKALSDQLLQYAKKISDDLTVKTWATIKTVSGSVALGLLLTLIFALWVGIKGLSSPIALLKGVMAEFAVDNLDANVPGTLRRDELGEMARTVEVFKKNALDVRRLRTEQEALKTQAEKERIAMLSKMADDLEASVGGVIRIVSSASTEMEASAQSLNATAEEASSQANAVASATDIASANVQTVASATEELSSSISEISNQVSLSARISEQAVQSALKTDAHMVSLVESVHKIDSIVQIINNIASQTNLLALNATIEAARAGDAGKGFAVVAGEVKNLAAETSKATEEIVQQISDIQTATNSSAEAIKAIGETINEMGSITQSIAAAVEEQSMATKSIAQNVQEAANGTDEVARNIVGVSKATSETGAAASQILTATGELSLQSAILRDEVGKFLSRIRAV